MIVSILKAVVYAVSFFLIDIFLFYTLASIFIKSIVDGNLFTSTGLMVHTGFIIIFMNLAIIFGILIKKNHVIES